MLTGVELKAEKRLIFQGLEIMGKFRFRNADAFFCCRIASEIARRIAPFIKARLTSA
jgi:hypothetical protein